MKKKGMVLKGGKKQGINKHVVALKAFNEGRKEEA